MAYDTVFFDLDGTLFDPGSSIPKSVQYALKRLGIDEQNPDALRRFVGPPLEYSFEKHYRFSESDVKKAVIYYREYFEAYGIHEYIIYPGIKVLLDNLVRLNIKLVIVTAKVDRLAEQVLINEKLLEYFEFVAARKHGEIVSKQVTLKNAIERLNLKADTSAVMVGDTSYDIIAAIENEIDSIGVTYGYGTEIELVESGATELARDTLELSSLLLG